MNISRKRNIHSHGYLKLNYFLWLKYRYVHFTKFYKRSKNYLTCLLSDKHIYRQHDKQTDRQAGKERERERERERDWSQTTVQHLRLQHRDTCISIILIHRKTDRQAAKQSNRPRDRQT